MVSILLLVQLYYSISLSIDNYRSINDQVILDRMQEAINFCRHKGGVKVLDIKSYRAECMDSTVSWGI